MVDDASPDGTQEVAKQLAGIYGEDRVVSGHCAWDSFHLLDSDRDRQVLKPRAGKLGLGWVDQLLKIIMVP